MRSRAAERSEASTPIPAWLERAAWNAAALTVLAVMLLVLLGSLEWLDRWDPTAKSEREARGAAPIAAIVPERARTIVARSTAGARGRPGRARRASASRGLALPSLGGGEDCAPPPRAG
jgi:hypothetical protein